MFTASLVELKMIMGSLLGLKIMEGFDKQ